MSDGYTVTTGDKVFGFLIGTTIAITILVIALTYSSALLNQ